MRIIHVLNTTDRGNGMVCAALDLASTQVKRGHEVYVCAGAGDLSRLFAQNGVPHIFVDQSRRPLTILFALTRLFHTFYRIRPDIVHVHVMTGTILCAALRPFFRYRMVATVHNEFQRSAVLMALGDKVIAVSNAVHASMARRGVPVSKLRTVLNGTVNSPRFSGAIPDVAPMSRPALVFLGGLHTRKGVDHLIKAFGMVLKEKPTAYLYIVGNGPQRPEYERLAALISQTNILFCGSVEDPRGYLRGADIFVLPSLADPAPLVLPEAREAGCAIVASAVDGIPELLDNGDAGILVPPHDHVRLAEAILKLLNDPAYLAEMRTRSQFNLDRFSVERVAEDTEKVYLEAIEG